MIKIENTVLPSPEQWKAIIMGARNPMNSWDRSDSYSTHIEDPKTLETADYEFFMGEKDHELLMKLAKGGSVHAKYRRMIPVYVDITAPLYWWKEFDTYKVGTVANSCSTMHKICSEPITFTDFSLDREEDDFEYYVGEYGEHVYIDDLVIFTCEELRKKYLATNDKKYWRHLIQLLPSSYNQKRTVSLNYEVLVGMYRDRKNHKLTEWHVLCDWIKTLPYSELITGEVRTGRYPWGMEPKDDEEVGV